MGLTWSEQRYASGMPLQETGRRMVCASRELAGTRYPAGIFREDLTLQSCISREIWNRQRCNNRRQVSSYTNVLLGGSILTSALFGHLLREGVHTSPFGHAIPSIDSSRFVRGIGITLSEVTRFTPLPHLLLLAHRPIDPQTGSKYLPLRSNRASLNVLAVDAKFHFALHPH